MPGVSPDLFVTEMSKAYSFDPSPALKQAWREMAITFNDGIEGKIQTDESAIWFYPGNLSADSQWNVLRLPTGTGKTQGIVTYCSLLSKSNEYPGVLIITKFTKEIEKIAQQINALSGKNVAFTDHSDKKDVERLSMAQCQESPILITTHQAYKNSLKSEIHNESAQTWWKKFTEWKNGERRLVIIDESLDVIEPVEISLDTLRMIRGWIPYRIEEQHPEKVGTLDKLIEQFLLWHRAKTKEYEKEKIAPEYWTFVNQEHLAFLRDELCSLPLSRMILGRADKGGVIARCKELFAGILNILSGQSWCQKRNGTISLRTAYVALPLQIKNAVILDATARLNRVYDLAGALPWFRQIPDDVRNYKNVFLYVHYGVKNTKYALMKTIKKETSFLKTIEALEPKIQKTERFLLVTFVKVENELSSLIKKHYPKCSIAHWGALNGKNDWQEYETIVLYGIQRLDDVTIDNIIIAFDNWHQSTQQKFSAPYACIDQGTEGQQPLHESTGTTMLDNFVTEDEYQLGFVSSEIIQAINRIRCRRVIDGSGGCASSKVYLLLNKGEDDTFEKSILDAVLSEMPGIVQAEPVTLEERTIQKLTAAQEAILHFFNDLEPGEYPAKQIYRLMEGHISPRTLQRTFKTINESPNSHLAQEMRKVVHYVAAMGKYGKSVYIRL